MRLLPEARSAYSMIAALLFAGVALSANGCRGAPEASPTPTQVVVGSIGQEIRIDRRRVMVDRTLYVDFLNYNERTAAARGRYLIVVLRIANERSSPESLSLTDYLLLDSRGQYHVAATSHHLIQGFNPSLAAAALLSLEPYDAEVPGFGVLSTALVFDVPRGTERVSLWLFDGRATVGLD